MVLEFLADGFEEIEAFCPADLMRRAKIDIKTVAVCEGDGKKVTGSHGISTEAELSLSDAVKIFEEENVEMIILPGGMPGAANLDANECVDSMVSLAAERGIYIAAICAAPMIPGKRGMLRGKRAVCYPGFEEYLDGAILTGGRVEADGNMITACGMGAAVDFALTLVGLMKGEKAAEDIRSAILAK